MNPEITQKDLYKIIQGLVNFPYGQICVHAVALDLLNLMETKGFEIPSELAKSLSKGSYGDDESKLIIKNILHNEG